MSRLPTTEILNVLKPAYEPCVKFGRECIKTATWAPQRGHVPRGFLGATGGVEDIKLVLLVAEPGNPHKDSQFQSGVTARSFITKTITDTYACFRDQTDTFHGNMRRILDLAFPDYILEDQLRRVWITNTYLCSAPRETEYVPAKSWKACGSTYLKAQLELLSGRPVIALGDKAYTRAKSLANSIPDLDRRLFKGYAASPPGCNRSHAYPSWCKAVEQSRTILGFPQVSATHD